jgi:hypothetical protein
MTDICFLVGPDPLPPRLLCVAYLRIIIFDDVAAVVEDLRIGVVVDPRTVSRVGLCRSERYILIFGQNWHQIHLTPATLEVRVDECVNSCC